MTHGYTVCVIRYAITDSFYRSNDAARWVAGSVDFVQLREKSIDAGALTAVARKILTALNSNTRLLIHGRADVALAAGAAGVHLTARPDELSPQQVRKIFAATHARDPVISVSCHTLADVERANNAGADLILFAPVFEKRIKGEVVAEGVGLESLRRACEIAGPSKILALGGITQENTQQCIAAGAAGVAGIRLFGGAVDHAHLTTAPSPPE